MKKITKDYPINFDYKDFFCQKCGMKLDVKLIDAEKATVCDFGECIKGWLGAYEKNTGFKQMVVKVECPKYKKYIWGLFDNGHASNENINEIYLYDKNHNYKGRRKI